MLVLIFSTLAKEATRSLTSQLKWEYFKLLLYFYQMEFQDKIVWITGASSGIGKALAIAFSERGAKVVLSSRREAELKKVADHCIGETLILPIDLLEIESFENKVQSVLEHFGRIDILVNNGGISQRGLASETGIEIDRKLMEINYFGNIALTKAVLPTMLSQKNGRIVSISSLSGKFGFFLRSAYAASKFALVGFYESLRLEEADNGISVHLVFPGFVKTNISQNALDSTGNKHAELDENQDKGITPEQCAERILKGINKNKRDIFVGGREMLSLKIQRWMPNLFHRIIKKQSAT